MIDAIKSTFELERETLQTYREVEPVRYNELLGQLHAVGKAGGITFGLQPRRGALDDFEREMYEKFPKPVTPRHLYKISCYDSEGSAKICLAYVSPKNPDPEILRFSDCFGFTRVDGKLQAVSHFQFDNTASAEFSGFSPLEMKLSVRKRLAHRPRSSDSCPLPLRLPA